MSKLENLEEQHRLPDWLYLLFPALERLQLSSPCRNELIVALEQAQTNTQKAKAELDSISAAEFAKYGFRKPDWTPEYARSVFAHALIKNFRNRVIQRDHGIYAPRRLPGKKLAESFSDHTRATTADLKNATWGALYQDIDTTMLTLGIHLDRQLIETALAPARTTDNNDGGDAVAKINIALVPVFILLAQKGYAIYPDLSL